MNGRDFQHLRRTVGLRTRRQAAAYVGVAENTVYRWESGRSRVPEQAMRMLNLRRLVRDLERAADSVRDARRASATGTHSVIRECFRQIRRAKGLSQAKLAGRAHVSRSWVAHLEKHGEIPSPELLGAALGALQLDTHAILDRVPFIGQALAALEPEACRILLAVLIESNAINVIPEPAPRARPRRPTDQALQKALFGMGSS